MKQVYVITTSGSIALKQGISGGGEGSPRKSGDLQSLLPTNDIQLAFDEFSNVPSSHFMPANGLKLAQRVESVLLSPDVSGVVVSQGTDTLEETAYLLDLTVNSPKPIVFTGSILPSLNPDYDGLANLVDAIRVAAAPEARELGVVVVFDEEIHAASEAQKVHTHARSEFQSPGSGPLGRIDGRSIWLRHRPLRRQYIPCSRLEETIDLICLTQGSDDRLLRHSTTDRVAGIVIEAFGSGRVPPWWLPAISDAIAQRTVVALTSRCLFGSLGDEHGYVGAYHDLRRLGVLLVHNLNGMKTRIKLMVALGAARNHEELRAWFKP